MLNPNLPSDDDLKHITVPMLIIWGDRDQFLPIENAVALYWLIPNAQLAVAPKADHFVTKTNVNLTKIENMFYNLSSFSSMFLQKGW